MEKSATTTANSASRMTISASSTGSSQGMSNAADDNGGRETEGQVDEAAENARSSWFESAPMAAKTAIPRNARASA